MVAIGSVYAIGRHGGCYDPAGTAALYHLTTRGPITGPSALTLNTPLTVTTPVGSSSRGQELLRSRDRFLSWQTGTQETRDKFLSWGTGTYNYQEIYREMESL
jgi:hypothetical protein